MSAAPSAVDVAVASDAPPIATVGWGKAMRRYVLPTPAAEVVADDDGGHGDAAAPAAATRSWPGTLPLLERAASITGWPLFGVGATLGADFFGGWLLALAVGLLALLVFPGAAVGCLSVRPLFVVGVTRAAGGFGGWLLAFVRTCRSPPAVDVGSFRRCPIAATACGGSLFAASVGSRQLLAWPGSRRLPPALSDGSGW